MATHLQEKRNEYRATSFSCTLRHVSSKVGHVSPPELSRRAAGAIATPVIFAALLDPLLDAVETATKPVFPVDLLTGTLHDNGETRTPASRAAATTRNESVSAQDCVNGSTSVSAQDCVNGSTRFGTQSGVQTNNLRSCGTHVGAKASATTAAVSTAAERRSMVAPC